ncbi:lipocalin family protein [Gabonibacter chumensis]|uniref:lipocalin family protein n=1 Tax=Gabonibacter chumensis TaxID=2972474 RepID=UPI002572DD7F|nr:lipocalin family protein [Gabonibacter chumensis]MCR9012563.1 lipocalin family protein [Gabonibacter chumensis]
MKKVIYLALFWSLLIVFGAGGCQSPGKIQTLSGVVFDASMNNIIVITTKGDTVDISTMDADPAKVPGVLIDDSVKISYRKERMGNGTVLKARQLIVTAHSPYYYIQGTWLEPNPIDADDQQGFTLNQDGTASSIGMATLEIRNWGLNDGVLILGYESVGNGQTIEGQDTLNIIKLNADSLVLSRNNAIRWRLARRK